MGPITISGEYNGARLWSVSAMREQAEREARHYVLMYLNEGPARVFEGRKRRPDLEPRP